MGEALARSSLVPRDLTAEIVFDCPSLRSGLYTPYGILVGRC